MNQYMDRSHLIYICFAFNRIANNSNKSFSFENSLPTHWAIAKVVKWFSMTFAKHLSFKVKWIQLISELETECKQLSIQLISMWHVLRFRASHCQTVNVQSTWMRKHYSCVTHGCARRAPLKWAGLSIARIEFLAG